MGANINPADVNTDHFFDDDEWMTMTGTDPKVMNSLSETEKLAILWMDYIEGMEERSFVYSDFLKLPAGGGRARELAYGSVKNMFSRLRKLGIIKRTGSKCGHARFSFSKTTSLAMTREGTGVGVGGDRIYNWLVNTPYEERALHNIRLRFKWSGIWQLAHSSGTCSETPSSKDIILEAYRFNEVVAAIAIHHNDTVSVSLACSEYPISEDIVGVNLLSSILARVEERLGIRAADWCASCHLQVVAIPCFMDWTLVQLHVGRDSLTSFSGERFEVTWADAAGALTRIYVDEKRGKRITRIEDQKTPQMSYREAARKILDGKI